MILKRIFLVGLFVLTLFGFDAPILAAPKSDVPRFACLRASKVNLRKGPGKRHPIDWTFTRQYLPVEVLAHYDLWRQVRTHEGITGWVHKRMLLEKQTAIVLSLQILRASDRDNSDPVAKIHPHVIGRVKKCTGPWCKLEVKGHTGWLKRQALWGVPQKNS